MIQPSAEETELREQLREKYCGDIVLERGPFAVTVRFLNYQFESMKPAVEITYSEPEENLKKLVHLIIDRLLPSRGTVSYRTAWLVWHPISDKMFLEYMDIKKKQTVKHMI